MKKYTLNILVAVISSLLTLVATSTLNSKDTQIAQLTTQVTALTTRLSVINDNLTHVLDKDDSQTRLTDFHVTGRGDESGARWIPDTTDNNSVQAVVNNMMTSSPDNAQTQGVRPGMVMVTPSAEQNATYEILKLQLEDPYYVSNLSLNELASSTQLKTLPEVMQLSILSQAITKFNNGEVSEEVFMKAVE